MYQIVLHGQHVIHIGFLSIVYFKMWDLSTHSIWCKRKKSWLARTHSSESTAKHMCTYLEKVGAFFYDVVATIRVNRHHQFADICPPVMVDFVGLHIAIGNNHRANRSVSKIKQAMHVLFEKFEMTKQFGFDTLFYHHALQHICIL